LTFLTGGTPSLGGDRLLFIFTLDFGNETSTQATDQSWADIGPVLPLPVPTKLEKT